MLAEIIQVKKTRVVLVLGCLAIITEVSVLWPFVCRRCDEVPSVQRDGAGGAGLLQGGLQQ